SQSSDGEWTERTKLIANDRAKDDEFGYAVAIDGSDVFIGANREDEDDNNGNTASAAGSVYVFKLSLPEVTMTRSACGLFEFGSQSLTESGTYTEVFTNQAGGDSTVTLIFENLETAFIEKNDTTLSVSEIEGVTYQWYNCDTQTAIDGAIQHVFSPAESGNYYVELSNGGCISETSCSLFNLLTSVEGRADMEIQAFPNPTTQRISIAMPSTNPPTGVVHVVDFAGRIHYVRSEVDQGILHIELPEAAGSYLIKIVSRDGSIHTARVIKK
ncbi:MAG: T9SS type A sorting domain-containing protein, partial [Bacteroidota bacterium]